MESGDTLFHPASSRSQIRFPLALPKTARIRRFSDAVDGLISRVDRSENAMPSDIYKQRVQQKARCFRPKASMLEFPRNCYAKLDCLGSLSAMCTPTSPMRHPLFLRTMPD